MHTFLDLAMRGKKERLHPILTHVRGGVQDLPLLHSIPRHYNKVNKLLLYLR
jgi:hypothetical protein